MAILIMYFCSHDAYGDDLYSMMHVNGVLQVRHLDTSDKSELHKLQQLKDEQGSAFLFCSNSN